MSAAQDLRGRVDVAPTCRALGVTCATLYRRRAARKRPRSQQPRLPSARALSIAERRAVLAVLNDERFMDLAPRTVWAVLLDEGRYLYSPRTMYRILAESGAVRERRNQLRHPAYKKPELLATAPNQVWSWDITKLKGPVKWSCFYLYVVLDIYSRNVVGWMLAECESGALATALIEQSCGKQGIAADQLTIHSDRGPPMISKPVAFLLADLGVTKSYSPLSAHAEHEGRLSPSERQSARLLLFQATGDRRHLEAAKRLLDEVLSRVPEQYHESMCRNLRLNREILAAWREEFGEEGEGPDGPLPGESPTRAE